MNTRELRLRCERRIVVGRRQREVELRRPAPQQPRELDVGPERLADERRRLFRRQLEQGMVGHRDAPLEMLLEGPIEVGPDLMERIAPGVAGVRHELLQDRDRRRLAPTGPVFERAGDRCGVREARPLRQEATDLEVGIHAFGDPPDDLQDQAVPVHDRSVALLAA
jgi:hypothetical protein